MQPDKRGSESESESEKERERERERERETLRGNRQGENLATVLTLSNALSLSRTLTLAGDAPSLSSEKSLVVERLKSDHLTSGPPDPLALQG